MFMSCAHQKMQRVRNYVYMFIIVFFYIIYPTTEPENILKEFLVSL